MLTEAMARDDIYRDPQQQLVDFAFNDKVVDVFPDMIRRSVPGYENIISMMGVFAAEYARDHSRIYDLGSSLGASTLAAAQYIAELGLEYHCVDNSAPMIEQCRKNLQSARLPDEQLTFHTADILDVEISNASLVMLNFTLQFIAPEQRLPLIRNIYNGLLPGGCLVLSEKICFEDDESQQRIANWHHAFKRANAYTELEISQKRAAIENILIPDSTNTHVERLEQAGFGAVERWFQNLNFASFIALKSE